MGLRALGLAVVLGALAPAEVGRAGSDDLAVVHVAANVGGSSGGHAGLRVGDRVYHLRQYEDDVIQLERDRWERFAYVYAGLQNRSLRVAYLHVAPADVEQIRTTFDRAFVRQELELETLRRLERDLDWLAALRGEVVAPRLRGAGLLGTEAGDPFAERLRDAVLARLPSQALDLVQARVTSILDAFARGEASPDLELYREALLEREALVALREARGLEAQALLPADVAEEPLTPSEAEALSRFGTQLEEAIASLLASSRPDRGFPLHLAMARWQALARSREEGRLRLLDPHPDDASLAEPDAGIGRDAYAKLAARAREGFVAGRAEILARASLDEASWQPLEEAAGRLAELEAGAAGRDVRQARGRLVPSRGRALELAPVGGDLDALGRHVEGALAQQRALVRERYGYDLVRRNCITELVARLEAAFPDTAAATQALGGPPDLDTGLGFVPFVFFDRVTTRLRVSRVEVIPSYRLRELGRLRRETPSPGLSLREATTVTSTIYRPRRSDGSFLLFTDDVFWRRPLYGTLNLGFGLSRTIIGLASAPFDGGAEALAGASGAFFSLPELAFVNIRKGSFAYVDPER